MEDSRSFARAVLDGGTSTPKAKQRYIDFKYLYSKRSTTPQGKWTLS